MAEQGDRRQVIETVNLIVSAIAPDRVDRIDESQQLVNDLGYDSLALVKLMVALEDCFSTSDQVRSLPPVGSVHDLYEYLLRTIAAGDARVPPTAGVEDYLGERVTGGEFDLPT